MAWPPIWRHWLTRSLASHGKHRIGSWQVCCGMSPSGLKQPVTDVVRLLAVQAVAEQAASTEQHQAVDEASGAQCDGLAVNLEQAALMGVCQVPSDVSGIARSEGDQRIERCAPSVHRGGNQVDMFDLRLDAGHGSVPHAAAEGLRPSFTAIS